MAIFIDTASIKEAQAAHSLGWVNGITTNPLLLAQAGGKPSTTLAALARLEMGALYVQLVENSLAGMRQELTSLEKLVGISLVVKLPPTPLGFQFASQCTGVTTCVTAVYSPAQALVASAAGASFVAVYVNRATRLLGDGVALVRQVAEVLGDRGTRIVAASLKSPEEACAALVAGAHHLTLSYPVLMSMMNHPLSEEALADFSTRGVGILSPQRNTP